MKLVTWCYLIVGGSLEPIVKHLYKYLCLEWNEFQFSQLCSTTNAEKSAPCDVRNSTDSAPKSLRTPWQGLLTYIKAQLHTRQTSNFTFLPSALYSVFRLCTPPSTPIDTFSLDNKIEKWRDLLRAPSFERSAQDRDGKSLSDPLCSVLHNRRLRRVCAAVAFRRRNAFKGTSRLTPRLGLLYVCSSTI